MAIRKRKREGADSHGGASIWRPFSARSPSQPPFLFIFLSSNPHAFPLSNYHPNAAVSLKRWLFLSGLLCLFFFFRFFYVRWMLLTMDASMAAPQQTLLTGPPFSLFFSFFLHCFFLFFSSPSFLMFYLFLISLLLKALLRASMYAMHGFLLYRAVVAPNRHSHPNSRARAPS
jgi:hypothetical protein